MGTKCGNMTTDLGIYRDAVSTANTLIIMEKGNLIEKQQICLDANSAASRSKFLHFKSVLTILALCLCMMLGGEAWGQEVKTAPREIKLEKADLKVKALPEAAKGNLELKRASIDAPKQLATQPADAVSNMVLRTEDTREGINEGDDCEALVENIDYSEELIPEMAVSTRAETGPIYIPHGTGGCLTPPNVWGYTIPIWMTKKYTSMQMIYTASELSECGIASCCKINKIAFYLSHYNVAASRTIKIYLDETTSTTYSSDSDWKGYSTEVFSGTISMSAVGWYYFDITDYDYKGGNLVISVDDNTSSNSNNNNFFGCTEVSNSVLYRSGGSNTDFSGNGNRGNYRPAVVFYVDCPNCNETIILNQNISQTINCGTTYCFYDEGGCSGKYTDSKDYRATFTSNGRITLSFSSFYTESTHDYMEVYDGGNLIRTASGTTVPSDVIATSGTMTVVWHSDYSLNYSGWAATITAENCCTDPNFNISGCPAGGNLALGSTQQLSYSRLGGGAVTWSSDNTSVATVSNTGLVSAVGMGSATITATLAASDSYCARTATCDIDVTCSEPTVVVPGPFNYSQGASVSPFTPAITYNGSSLPAGTTYSSNNTSVASVNNSGVLTVNTTNSGNATITVTIPASSGYCSKVVTYNVSITCTNPGLSISGCVAGNMNIGDSRQLSASYNGGGNLTWSSDDTNIATVSSSGLVTAVAEGTTTIRARLTANDAYCSDEATCSVTIGCDKIGNGTNYSSSGTYGGIYTWNNYYAYTQQLYLASELAPGGGIVNEISLHYQESTSSALSFEVYIGQTTQNTVPTTWITDANLTQVYSGTMTFTSANNGWNVIDISSHNWEWDGTSNIVVAIRRTSTTQGSVQYPNFYHTNSSNMAAYISNSSSSISLTNNVATSNGTITSERPEIKFCIERCTQRTGTFAFAAEHAGATIGTAFTAPRLNNFTGATPEYSSSNTSVATVNPTTGEVSIVGEGLAVITATLDTEDGVYCAKSTSYTLTVSGTDIIMGEGIRRTIECGTIYNFYDDGGADGNYAVDEFFTGPRAAVFTSRGDITINFSQFVTELNADNPCGRYDFMKIYDGDIATGTMLAWGQTGCDAHRIDLNHDYVATSGTMTIEWQSDDSDVAAGWAATITADDCCTPRSEVFAFEDDYMYALTGVAFMPPVLRNEIGSGTITYSSDNTDVALVDNAGHVVLVGNEGLVTITAIYEASGEYCASEAFYTINVSNSCEVVVNGATTSSEVPLRGESYMSYAQMIYTASEIRGSDPTGTGIIRSIAFDSRADNSVYRNVKIYMAMTDKNAFTSATDFIPVSDMTLVYAGGLRITEGWNVFNIDDFMYTDGSKNIVVALHSKASASAATSFSAENGSTYKTVYAYSTSSSPEQNPNPVAVEGGSGWSSYSGTTSRSYYRPNAKFCIDKAAVCEISYNTTANCAGATDIPSTYGLANIPVALSSVIPECSSGTFIGWSTSQYGDVAYDAGDFVTPTGPMILYAKYKDCSGFSVTVTKPDGAQSDDDGTVIDGVLTFDVCYGSVLRIMAAPDANHTLSSCTWEVNPHNGIINNYTGASLNYPVSYAMGHDITLHAVATNGCPANIPIRARVSKGLLITGDDPSAGRICVGNSHEIVVGNHNVPNVVIDIENEAIDIKASKGESEVTFLPDGCANVYGEPCYESGATFADFPSDARIESADNIDYVRINLEHSFIGDMQISVVCPNGQSALILEDKYATGDAQDGFVYDWPYTTLWCYALYKKYYDLGNCVKGEDSNPGYVYYALTYVVYNGSYYSGTGNRAEATAFVIEDNLWSSLYNPVRNMVNAATAHPPADFCKDGFVYEFVRYEYSANDYASYNYDEDWGSFVSYLAFGEPSRIDDDSDACDASLQPHGVGYDYCWSNNTTSGYGYANGTYKYVREIENHQPGINTEMAVIPSNVANHTQFYHPFEDFSGLVGCPLNGEWKIKVCDSWAGDNGYIFEWEIVLKSIVDEAWSYNVELESTSLGDCPGSGNDTLSLVYPGSLVDPSLHTNFFIHPTLQNVASNHITIPTYPDGADRNCELIIHDNLGCKSPGREFSYTITQPTKPGMDPTTICLGETTTIDASLSTIGTGTVSGTPHYYWWLNDERISHPVTGATAHLLSDVTPASSSDVYGVEVYDGNGCGGMVDTVIKINVPDDIDDLSDYTYIWRGAASTDWNVNTNWYTYNDYEEEFRVASVLPSLTDSVYIGASQCTNRGSGAGWPVQTGDANAFNLTIANGASLTVPSGKTLNIAGNLDNIGSLRGADATLAKTDGTVVFCGPSSNGGDQTISNNITLGNVTFYNQGGDIVPAGSVTITGDATFTDGIVKKDLVTFGTSSSVANAETMTYNSYVEGMVTKTGSANGFTFPTGQNNVLGKVKVSSDVSGVSVRYHNNPAGFGLDVYPRWWNINDMCSGNTTQFDHVSNFEYWDIATTGVLNAKLTVSSVDSSAHFNSVSPTHNGGDVYGAFWNGNCWENIGGANHSVSAYPYGTISVDVSIPATRAYSKIVSLGSKNHSTVLPIELTALTATCDGRSSLVEWTTASERNNDYFSLERSDDAINFTEIARIAGAGNSIAPLDYSYTDYGVHGGDNYYRLVQVDYDGTRTASEIVVANCIEASGEPEVLAYPNPFGGDLTVELENFGDRPARIDVYDMLGRLVYTEEVGAPQNSYQTVLHFGNLPDATYTVRVGTADFVINRKVVKQQ